MKNRTSSRSEGDLRDVRIETHINPYAEGSCKIAFGHTEIICTVSIQDKVPLWMRGKRTGWITAEYGMLPRATGERKDREATKGRQEGRTIEIQRLIGRSLRCACDLKSLDGLTFWLDCDVIIADGGTRTASITGAWVALALALKNAVANGKIKEMPVLRQIAAVSCGLSESGVLVDLDYAEDSAILADSNFVMDSDGQWIEVQMSAERGVVRDEEFLEMQRLAKAAIEKLFVLQRQALEAA